MIEAASARNAAIHFFPAWTIDDERIDGNMTYFLMTKIVGDAVQEKFVTVENTPSCPTMYQVCFATNEVYIGAI